MIRKTCCSALALAASCLPLPTDAQDRSSNAGQATHYAVRFGATIGDLEPVAGEMLCAFGKDCAILLSFVPMVELRMRADKPDGRSGLVTLDCRALSCGFLNGLQWTSFERGSGDLRIVVRADQRTGLATTLVWQRGRPLGRFTFAVVP